MFKKSFDFDKTKITTNTEYTPMSILLYKKGEYYPHVNSAGICTERLSNSFMWKMRR